ncbi:hypothetical protein C3941_06110 [Kaistia algarum]|nr:hypothetical protein C3941_06110 [Kaistia algarum]
MLGNDLLPTSLRPEADCLPLEPRGAIAALQQRFGRRQLPRGIYKATKAAATFRHHTIVQLIACAKHAAALVTAKIVHDDGVARRQTGCRESPSVKDTLRVV